jgi:hypothetical protein
MKKIAIILLATCMSLTFLPLQASASTTEPVTTMPAPKPVESSEAKTLELRLNELNSMDKTKLKASEKKSMRKEVRSINHKLREIGGGVYISAGALILILILLIVLV